MSSESSPLQPEEGRAGVSTEPLLGMVTGAAQSAENPAASAGIMELPISEAEHDAFAAHVAAVQKHGDALNISAFRRKILGAGLMTGTLLPAIPEVIVNNVDNVTSGVMLFSGAIVAVAARAVYTMRRMPRSDRLLGAEAQDAVGERYNLYRTGHTKLTAEPPRLGICYYGPLRKPLPSKDGAPPETQAGVLAHIQKLARLAREHNISEIAVSKQMIDPLRWVKYYPTTFGAFLQSYDVPFASEPDELASLPPNQWLSPQRREYFSDTAPKTLSPLESIDKLVKTLASVRPQHSLVRIYQTLGPSEIPKNDKKQEKLLKQLGIDLAPVVTMSVNHGFADIAHYRVGGRDVVGITDLAPDRKTAYLPAALPSKNAVVTRQLGGDGEYNLEPIKPAVVWHDRNGALDRVSDIAQATGMSPIAMDELLKAPHTNPDQLAKLVTLLVADSLRSDKPDIPLDFFKNNGRTVLIEPESLVDIPIDYAADVKPHNAQETWLPATKKQPGWRGTIRRRAKTQFLPDRVLLVRVGCGVAAGAYVVGIAAGFGTEARDTYTNAVTDATQELADAQGLDAGDIPKDDAQHLAEANSFSMQAVGSTIRFEQGLHTFLSNLGKAAGNVIPAPAAPPAASQMNLSPVGNASSDGPARDDWILKADAGISTQGYWAVGTSAILEHNQAGMGWKLSDDYQNPVSIPTHITKHAPAITASRELSAADYRPDGDDFVVPVPILDGTSVVAGNFDGHPISMLPNPNGTAVLDIGSKSSLTNGPHKLEYFLQKDPYALSVHATQLLNEENGNFDKPFDRDLQRIDRDWDKVIPGFMSMSTYNKALAVADYIHRVFDYRVDPFEKNTTIDGRLPSTFVEKELDIKKANCNGASTLDALSVLDGDPNMQPNIAVGYLNGGADDTHSLNTHQLHQWLVFRNGERLDATPIKGQTDADEAYLHPHKPTPHQKNLPIDPLDAGVGIAALTVAILQRRRLVQGVRRASEWGKDKVIAYNDRIMTEAFDAFEATNERDIFVTAEVANALRFDPDQNVGAASTRGLNAPPSGYDPDLSTPDLQQYEANQAKNPFNKLAETYMHGAYIENLLRQAAAESTDAGERAVLESSLAIVTEAWNLQFAGNSAVKYLLCTRLPGYRSYQLNRSK